MVKILNKVYSKGRIDFEIHLPDLIGNKYIIIYKIEM